MTDAPKLNPLHADGLPMSCADCRWYSGNVLNGLCFGVPPVPVVVGVTRDLVGNSQPQLSSFFPSVSADRYCGMFAPDRDRDLEPIIAVEPPLKIIIETEEAA